MPSLRSFLEELGSKPSAEGQAKNVAFDATRPIGGYPRRHTLPPESIASAAAMIAHRSRV